MSPEPLDVCNALVQWAKVADVTSKAGSGYLAIAKSDLLARLIYGGEAGPSETPCPVHKGVWSGCHWGWPGVVMLRIEEGRRTEYPDKVEPLLQAWYDAGCRCFQHKGSSCTTGWNPDEHCCLVPEHPVS